MGRSQNTFVKRQREQARKERAAAKLEKRQQRKTDKENGIENPEDIFDEPVAEEQLITPST